MCAGAVGRKDLVERAVLHDAARVHHGDAVRDVCHHTEIVGHEDRGRPGLSRSSWMRSSI